GGRVEARNCREKFRAETFTLAGEPRQARVEVLVNDARLDGDGDAGRRGDERLGDALRHDGEAAAAVLRDRSERGHDADDGAVEADERRRRADRAEDPQARLQVDAHALPRAVDRLRQVVVARAALALEPGEE